jgi:hypothetical protein
VHRVHRHGRRAVLKDKGRWCPGWLP